MGAATLNLAERFGYRVSGIDRLPESIARASRRAVRRRAPTAVDFALGTVAALDFPDGVFDGAVTLETLVHAADPRVVLAELRRVLRPSGRLVPVECSIPDPREPPEDERPLRVDRCFVDLTAAVEGWRRLQGRDVWRCNPIVARKDAGSS